MYPVQTPNPPRPQGAAIPIGWAIIYDANGNPVYIKERK